MHIGYQPQGEKDWIKYYRDQATQSGHGMYVGLPYQRGFGLGSIFGRIIRGIAPLAKSALKTVGKEALHTGVQIASDALKGEDIAESAKVRGRKAAAILLDKADRKMSGVNKKRRKKQTGRGLGFRPPKSKSRSIKTIKGSRKRVKDVLGY